MDDLRTTLTASGAAALGFLSARVGIIAAVAGAAVLALCSLVTQQSADAQRRIEQAIDATLKARPGDWRAAVDQLADAERRLNRLTLPAALFSVAAAGAGVMAGINSQQRPIVGLVLCVVTGIGAISCLLEMRAAGRIARSRALAALVNSAEVAQREELRSALESPRFAWPEDTGAGTGHSTSR